MSPVDPDLPDALPPLDGDVDLVPSVPKSSASSPRLWGPWATIGWTLLCIVVIFAAQTFAVIMYAAFRMATNPKARIDDLATDGNLWSFATVLSTPAAVGLVLLLIYLRRYPIRGYLALYWPSRRSLAISFVGLLALIVATDLTTYLLGKPLVPRVMADVFRTGWMPGLLLAVLVLAPIGEETLFRGFLYTGIAASRAGPIVAIAVSSIIFALMHVQYDWYGVVAVAAIGLYLGVVRYRAQSLLLTMLLHSVASMIATTELFVEEYWLG